MRKIQFRVTRDMFPQVKDRYPYVYLEHGRLEVDDSSVKWISADGYVVRLPVATIGSLFLGPGTSVTHAAMHAVGSSGCTVCWTGAESLPFMLTGCLLRLIRSLCTGSAVWRSIRVPVSKSLVACFPSGSRMQIWRVKACRR